jgi:hypothetical protein
LLRVDPRNDLAWFFNEAVAEIAALRSTWPQEARAKAERSGTRDPLRNYVYVPSGELHSQARGFDGRAVAAATRHRRIAAALTGVGHEVEHVLRLRFGEVLTAARAMFSAGDADRVRTTLLAAGAKNRVTRERARLTAISRRAQLERGPGSVAHLTEAALVAYAAARTTRTLEAWVDHLGQRLSSGTASAPERALQTEIRRQAEKLVARAWVRYQEQAIRVPDLVRRRAADRAA